MGSDFAFLILTKEHSKDDNNKKTMTFQETGNTLIMSLNPITGAPVGERTLHLNTKPLQCALLHKADKQKLHALLLLDIHENVHVSNIDFCR